ncbi:MAG: methionine adenosyltransferase [Actinomycetaceae bacterium]|nr:methionine adenosyltransferase [Arcanobacterium sp.]MDD7686438.1 methionine adenosyltransferase [Actinomycetaceae bacterium]MDY5272718.1 methionine adenosyltransferase [Arcanobacterium sp.]
MMQLFTSESVTEGHPDKVCDQISDAILDAMLAEDPHSRVAVETLATTGLVHVAGEVTTQTYVEIPELIRSVLKDIGYVSSEIGFDAGSCGIELSIGQQSHDIADSVNDSLEMRSGKVTDRYDRQGAGDQGMMFGYATNETKAFMPMPIYLAHQLAKRLADVRKSGEVAGLRPDGKTQVTVRYDDAGKPAGIETVVVSTQHHPDFAQADLSREIEQHVVKPVLSELVPDFTDYSTLVNPSGRFVIGGPMGDAGLTGRKIIVDTYGGFARHGGGAFSGKDPSKVDRSGAYAARWVAKNVVAAGLADRCEVQVAYAIGRATPVSLLIDTFGTEKVELSRITNAVHKVFDLRPAAIIDALDLLRPIYRKTASYGHFGRDDADFTWERTDQVTALLAAI